MPCVIQIDGWNPAGPGAVAIRLASHDDEGVCQLDGQRWTPALATLPVLRYDLFSGSFDGRIGTPGSSFRFATEPWPALPGWLLADARVRLWTGEAGAAFPAWVLRFDGRATTQPAIEDGFATLDIAVDTRWLDAPLLATYAGTGGIEGGAELKGVAKPLALGAPRYAEGVLIDPVNSIVQLSAYGRIAGIEAALERLARFGAPVADHASYSALAAADVPRGRWATSLADGLARQGAPPEGRLSYMARGDAADGWARLPGSVIRRIVAIAGQAARIDEGSLSALNVKRPWRISLMVTEQTSVGDLIQRVAASVNATAGVTWTGKLFVAPIDLIEVGAPATMSSEAGAQLTTEAGLDLLTEGVAALTGDGTGGPPVASIAQLAVGPPWWRAAIEAQRTWAVHDLSEIATADRLNDAGRYLAGRSYRPGDVIDRDDGSRWLYVNPAAAAAPPPPDTIFWAALSPALTAAGIVYVDGTAIETLKPAEAGATEGAPAGTPVGATAAETVEAGALAANQGLNPDGSVQAGKVGTDAIVAGGVSANYFAQIVSAVTLTNAVEIEIVNIAIAKAIASSDLDIDCAVRFASSDDLRGTLSLYRDATLVSSFALFMNGNGGSFRTIIPFPFTESGLATGSYTYRLKFTRNGGASTVTAEAGSRIQVREIKR